MDDEFLKEIWDQFVIEVNEHCSNNEDIFISASSDKIDSEQINSAFRAFHTIKGLSRSLSLSTLEKIAHSAEDVLGDVRDGTLSLNDDALGVLLKANDAMKNIAEKSSKNKIEITEDQSNLLEELSLIRNQKDLKKNIVSIKKFSKDSEIKEYVSGDDKSKTLQNAKEKSITISSDVVEKIFSRTGTVVTSLSDLSRIIETKILHSPNIDLTYLKDICDKAILQASLLNEEVLDLRVFPMSDVIRRVKRSGFEAAKSSGKKVEILVKGESSRADRNIVRAVMDPLMHIVRNAVDHGIELPNKRNGKTEKGKVQIDISTSSNGLEIIIEDDGKGIDPKKVLDKAIEIGLTDRESSKDLNDEKIFDFLFYPGFSTSEKVTDTSGRGVGMDVVKTNVALSGGTIEMNSIIGKGTKFTLKFPQITNTENCIVMESNAALYALPSRHVLSIIRGVDIENSDLSKKGMIRFEKYYLPIINFESFANITSNKKDENYLIVNFNDKAIAIKYFGKILIRDLVFDEPDPFIASLPYISGVTISDGDKIVLQIDLFELIDKKAKDSIYNVSN